MTKYLYRKAMQAVTLATAIAAFSSLMCAQFRLPQPERTTPRAIGVLETFKNGSQRLVPITFFYEKHYYDATFYHATPVPFTLYSETVYEVQQLGKPLGTYTIRSASQHGAEWFGNGRYKAAPDPATLAKKAVVAPVVVEDPSRPVLHRREGSEGDVPRAHPAQTSSTPEAEEDPDRPKLHRREGSDSGTGGNTTAQNPAPPPGAGGNTSTPANTRPAGGGTEESSGKDPDRPKLHHKDDSTTTAGTAGASGCGNGSQASAPCTPVVVASKTELTPSDDPDHPILRRGKPIQEQSGRDLPDFKKEEPVSRMIAVSDAGVSEPQPLIYVCSETERQQIETSARELAQNELRRLGAQRGLVSPQEKTLVASAKAPVAASKKKATIQLSPLPLKDEQFIPYDLDYNNYATVVYSARYLPEGEQNVNAKGKGWVVTVVAREEDAGKLVKLYSAVSDPRELDLYPEVRLVDAVDPDGYGRMAFLFREQKRDGVSWLLGRPTGYELQTVFETPSR